MFSFIVIDITSAIFRHAKIIYHQLFVFLSQCNVFSPHIAVNCPRTLFVCCL